MKRILTVIFLTTTTMQSAQAQFWSGNDLYQGCILSSSAQNTCAAYIIGTIDAFLVYGVANKNGAEICIPAEIPSGQLVDVAIKYLSENPKGRHYSAASEISVALKHAFPCR